MKLKEYSGRNLLTLDEFLSLDKEEAVRFDFLTQGEEADRSELANSIYQELFPWFDRNTHAGDTLNTYHIAVKKYYGEYYRFLNREVQLKILKIIKKYTFHDETQIFEFEETDKDGNTYYQLCNNYQLGNLGILPINGGINPKRAQAPYFDFFDNFLNTLSNFYNNSLDKDNELEKAIYCQSSYFNQFDNNENFFNLNYLFSFVEDINQDTYYLKQLSSCQTFEEYVALATDVVKERSEELFNALHGETNETDLSQRIKNNSQLLAKKYSIDSSTATQLAKSLKLIKIRYERDKVGDEYKRAIDSVRQDYNSKITQVKGNNLRQKYSWMKWWYWLILYFLIYILRIMNPINFTLIRLLRIAFWTALVAKVIYDISFKGKKRDFEKNKETELDELRKEKWQDCEVLRRKRLTKRKIFDIKHKKVYQLRGIFPSDYVSDENIIELCNYITDKRANNFKEAYELLDKRKHRQRLEYEAERTRKAAEYEAERTRKAAEYQTQVYEATLEASKQQAISLEEQARQIEELKQEIESLNREREE